MDSWSCSVSCWIVPESRLWLPLHLLLIQCLAKYKQHPTYFTNLLWQIAYFSKPSNAAISCSNSRIVCDCRHKRFCSLPDGTTLDTDERCRLWAEPSSLDLDGLEGSEDLVSTPFSAASGNSAMSKPNAIWEISDRFIRLLNSRAAASLPVTVKTVSNAIQSLKFRRAYYKIVCR